MSDRPRTYLDCSIVRTVDGDTADVTIDLGLRTTRVERIRLHGIDCPEMHATSSTERTMAQAAKAFTDAWMQRGPFDLTTYLSDDFGRWLGVPLRDGESLPDLLVSNGLAVAWPTRWHEVHGEEAHAQPS